MDRVTVDVYRSFTQENGEGGNPAGVAMHTGLTREQMQKTAREMNLSETAFLKHISDGTKYGCYEVLFYTKDGSQVALCGHATIAAGEHVFTNTSHKEVSEYNQKYEYGDSWKDTMVRRDPETGMIFYKQFVPPSFAYFDTTELLEILGLSYEDLDTDHFEPTVRFTDGLLALKPDVFDALPKDCSGMSKEIAKFLQRDEQKLEGVHLFTFSDDEKVIARCRNIAPAVGIPEESATGSVTALLLADMRRQEIINAVSGQKYMFIQGENLENSHSELFAYFDEDDVWVGGRVQYEEKKKIVL